MKSLSTTRMSSKGQVVIPEEIRKSLSLTEGHQFVVLGEKDVIILKVVTPPSMKDFDNLIKKARAEAKKVGLKKSNIQKIIKTVRTKKND
jgi:AbrB family looped-hinge helix DNA binding protein